MNSDYESESHNPDIAYEYGEERSDKFGPDVPEASITRALSEVNKEISTWSDAKDRITARATLHLVLVEIFGEQLSGQASARKKSKRFTTKEYYDSRSAQDHYDPDTDTGVGFGDYEFWK